MSEKIRVLVADDHPIYRAGVVQSLELDTGIEVVGEAASADAAVEAAVRTSPDLVLMDISMPGDGVAATQALRERVPGARVAMLTVSENDADVMRALQAGAVGYVLKGIEATHLIEAVRAIAAGGSYMSPNLALQVLSAQRQSPVAQSPGVERLATLSKTERKVLRLIADGMSNDDIAREIGFKTSTAKFHVGNILTKLEAKNRVEAAIIARSHWTIRSLRRD
jgi:two-component system, NarL family, nitrate/nitrite response regulator NarL